MKLRDLRLLGESDEDSGLSDGDRTIAFLFDNCGPWLSRYGVDKVLNRSSNSVQSSVPYVIKDVHQDRFPMSIAVDVQNIIVNYIQSRATKTGVSPGIANRNNSAFCYVNHPDGGSSTYGRRFAYFPIGEFRTTYIEGVEDLYHFLDYDLTSLNSELRSNENIDHERKQNIIKQATTILDAQLRNHNIIFDDLSKVGSEEVIVKSDKGVYVPQRLFEEYVLGELRDRL